MAIKPPASLLACKPQPPVPAPVTDAALASFIVDLADAGADCRAKLSAIKEMFP